MFAQLKEFSAEAENLNVDALAQLVIESNAEFSLQRECVTQLIKDGVTAVVRGIASGHDLPAVLLTEGPIILIQFFRCQFGFGSVQAEAAASSCALQFIGAMLRGDDLTTALSGFVSCVLTKGKDGSGDQDNGGGVGVGGGGQQPGGGGGRPQNKPVRRCG